MIVRSEFLEDLIVKMNAKEEINYRIMRGHVYESAIDQYGSRFI